MLDTWVVPPPLFMQACKDIEARRKNGGCWIDGKIPDSLLKIKELYNLQDGAWVQTVESVVAMMAISRIAELFP